MIFEVKITSQGETDLRGIYEYIAFELKVSMNAKNQIDRLEEAIKKLDTFPERYSRYPKEPWRSRGLRFMPVDNYLVYFIPDSNRGLVWIIRVMYRGRDVEHQLNEKTEY
jgi:Plasmid stabilisation system protein.